MASLPVREDVVGCDLGHEAQIGDPRRADGPRAHSSGCSKGIQKLEIFGRQEQGGMLFYTFEIEVLNKCLVFYICFYNYSILSEMSVIYKWMCEVGI